MFSIAKSPLKDLEIKRSDKYLACDRFAVGKPSPYSYIYARL
jgi:hypothetical protein